MLRRLMTCLLALVAVAAVGCAPGDEGAEAPRTTPGEPPAEPLEPGWHRVEAEGPSARTDHAMATSGEAVYVFGGRSNRQEFGDLWRLDLASGAWTELSSEGPGPRFGPAFQPQPDGTLILFGGENRSAGAFFDDVWRYHPSEDEWSLLAEGGGPAPRYGAGSAVDAEGALYLTHGFTDTGRFDDTWSFSGGRFNERSGEGERPLARCLLHAAYYQGGLFLFGGQSNPEPFMNDLWRLDLDQGRWQRVESDSVPSARNLYAAARSGDGWWLHGGRGPEGRLGDLWRLDLPSGSFERIDMEDGPSPRSGHAAAALPEGLVVFGGAGEDGELADTWLLAF